MYFHKLKHMKGFLHNHTRYNNTLILYKAIFVQFKPYNYRKYVIISTRLMYLSSVLLYVS